MNDVRYDGVTVMLEETMEVTKGRKCTIKVSKQVVGKMTRLSLHYIIFLFTGEAKKRMFMDIHQSLS